MTYDIRGEHETFAIYASTASTEPIIKIWADGRVELGPLASVDEAALEFWGAVVRNHPFARLPSVELIAEQLRLAGAYKGSESDATTDAQAIAAALTEAPTE